MGRTHRALWVILAPLVSVGTSGCGSRPPEDASRHFIGSGACEGCHQDIYDRWAETLMANVVVDPAAHPDFVLGDFSTPDPLVTFALEDIALVYGSKWKQRYFTRVGDDYYVFPAQWDIQNGLWRRYFPQPGADWWAEYYPADQMQRPTGPLCDGCRSVNYDVTPKTVTEWNVGCERCHGAGSLHAELPVAETIVNPNWPGDPVRANDVCIQCHSQGRPRANPIQGQYYDWPVGYQPGAELSDVWVLDDHRLGEETFTHWPDGTAHKNRMQGNDYVQSQMYLKGVTCSACHDVHGTEHEADLREPGNAVCTQCHSPQLQPGPRGPLSEHTQHAEDGEGSRCVACHMPAGARGRGRRRLRHASPHACARHRGNHALPARRDLCLDRLHHGQARGEHRLHAGHGPQPRGRPRIMGAPDTACFVAGALIRTGVPHVRQGSTRGARLIGLALGLVTLVLVQQTAERGARLVFEQGVGVISGPGQLDRAGTEAEGRD